jgi:hypothetical protein
MSPADRPIAIDPAASMIADTRQQVGLAPAGATVGIGDLTSA